MIHVEEGVVAAQGGSHVKVLKDSVPVGLRNQGERSEYTIHMNCGKIFEHLNTQLARVEVT